MTLNFIKMWIEESNKMTSWQYRQNSPLSFGEKGVAWDFHVKEFFLGDKNERSRTLCTSSEFEDA